MADPVRDDEPAWARDVPSEIHGPIEHLRYALRDQAGDPHGDGETWAAVYGQVSLEPPKEELQKAARAAAEGGVVAAVAVTRDMLVRVFSDRLHASLAAHSSIELALLGRLAEATGTPVATLLDDLDRWAAQRDGG